MGISEFALHNVLRTYSRQERLGQAQKPAHRPPPSGASSDRVNLSRGAQKAQWLGQVAAELVDLRHPHASAEERSAQIRLKKEELLKRHSDAIGDESVSPEVFQRQVRTAYLG